jgi:hypothetical protein
VSLRDVKMLTGSSRIEPVPIALEEGKKGNLVMNILKLVLLTLFRLAFFGVLKVVLVVYILFLPDSPLAGVAQEDDGHTGDTANAAQGAGIVPASLRRDAFSA